MEKDQQHLPWQSPTLNCTSFSPNSRWQNSPPAYTNPYTRMVSSNGSLEFGVSELPHLKTNRPNVPNGWFYCLPRHRQALTLIPNSAPKEFSALPRVGNGGVSTNAVSTIGQKGFLVFDQNGNHTSLIFNSLIGSPVQHPSSVNSKQLGACALPVEEPTMKSDPIYQAGSFFPDGLNENQETGARSEMHEDTEELNALLYSDDDDYEDEETSTGHSPCQMMMGYEKRVEAEESAEEVGSSAGPTKRKRQHEDDVLSLVDTASSGKPNQSCEEGGEDVQSSCVEGKTQGGELGSLSANKRLKRERIQETISILKSIIPGGQSNDDAMLVLDEAIQYLRFLKLKTKSLGEIM